MADVQESKITDEHRARIGVESEPAEVHITEEDAKRVRDLLEDDDPRYADGTGIAPPYVLAVIDQGMPWELMPRVLPGGLLTQTEWKFHAPLKIGATLQAVHRVIDVRDRLGGRYGYSVLVMTQTDYRDENGKTVASGLRTITQFDQGGSVVTERFFEDIQDDEELPPVEKLPTEDQAIEFFGRDNPTNPAFRDAELGKKQGFGGALVPGLLKMAWLTQYVGHWAGPAADIRSIRIAYRRPDIAGKPLTLAGRVVDKRQEDGKNIVELEVVTLAEGQPSVRGNVQVAVPSRS